MFSLRVPFLLCSGAAASQRACCRGKSETALRTDPSRTLSETLSQSFDGVAAGPPFPPVPAADGMSLIRRVQPTHHPTDPSSPLLLIIKHTQTYALMHSCRAPSLLRLASSSSVNRTVMPTRTATGTAATMLYPWRCPLRLQHGRVCVAFARRSL